MKCYWTSLIMLGAALLLSSGLPAQEFRASILGRITDSSSAVIGDAKVSATNVETGIASRTVSSKDGAYLLPALQPGSYKLEIESIGFRKYVREGIILQIQERPTIDVVLEPGEITSSVTVSADASQLDTSSASRGDVISGRTVVDMPLNGRNAFALAALAPGVNFTARGQASTFLRTTANNGMSAVALSGGQPRSNEALLDGVPNTGSDGLILFVPSVDATQEFKVQTNVFDSQFGRFTGGLINATIRSGTNQVHGALFEFVRNSAFNARDPFAATIPQFGYNLFGESAGGPVFVPKVYNGTNHTFFFFNYEGSREGVPRANVATVPTDLQRHGDFSQTFIRQANGSLVPVTIYDPATTAPSGSAFVRTAFPGNVILPNRFDSAARNLLNLFPAPNAPGDAGTGANNFLSSFKDPVLDNGYIIKIDHNFSERHRVFGRYSWRHFHVGRQGAFKNPITGDAEDRYAPGVAFDDSLTLNPTTILNFRYGFSRFTISSQADNFGFDVTKLGFPASFANQIAVPAIPEVDIAGYTSLSGANKFNRAAEDTHTFRASVIKVIGRLTTNAGGEYRLLRSNNGSLGVAASGLFAFDSAFTRGPNPQVASTTAGSGLASFLLGLGSSGRIDTNAATAEQSPYSGFYIQNDFRVSSRLTLNFGLRYEWEGAYTERYNRINRGFDLTTDESIAAQARLNYAASPIPEVPAGQFQVRGGLQFAGVNGQPRAATNLDRNNLAPRVGLAWSLNAKTVVRGGFGYFFGPTTILSETRQGFSQTTPFVGTIDSSLTFVNTLGNPFPTGLLAPTGASLGLLTQVGQSVSFIPPDRQQPLSRQYQASIQRELPGQILIEAAYAGSSSRDLPVTRQIDGIPAAIRSAARDTFLQTGRNILNDTATNPFFGLIASGPLSGKTTTRGQLVRPYPQFTSISEINQSIGSSRYDSMQIKANKRFSGGVSFLAAYTFAKQLDQFRFLNEQDTRLTRELNDSDIPHHFVFSSIYELPFGPGKRFFGGAKGFAQNVIGGWQLNGVYTLQSGIPLEITGAESLGRSAELNGDAQTVNRWFDTSAFRQRQTLELASTARLPDVRSARKNNADISMFKNTNLTEHIRLQFRTEVFNAFNHPEWSSPNTTFGNANFGRVTSTNTFARQLQFGLKLLW